MTDLSPIWLTLKLAICTSFILLCIAIPLSLWLSGKKTFFKTVVQTIISLPLVLPPTVLGFYLLLAFSPNHVFGNWLEKWLHVRLVFSFLGLLLASVIYNLPFMVHPVFSGLASLPSNYKEAAYSLGKSKWRTVFSVLLPNIRASLLTGIVLSFAHAVGEFGIVLMIGGNIPGRTRTASVAIYDEVEIFNYKDANIYAGILLVISFVILFCLYAFNRKAQEIKFF